MIGSLCLSMIFSENRFPLFRICSSGRSRGTLMRRLHLAILLGTSLAASPASAARRGGDFNTFIASFSTEAQGAGISQEVIAQALGGVQQDRGVLAFDRRQRGTFTKTFEQYVSTRVGPGRI